MKKAAYITLISILLLALAGGAWLVDALRHSSEITLEPHRDRRTERYQAQQSARQRGSRIFTHGDALHFAVTR